MKSVQMPFFKMILYAFVVTVLIVIPVVATWASAISDDDVKLWKMWINLAISGYAEPMPMNVPGEKYK